MAILPPCPHCGKVDAVYVKGHVSGPMTFYFDEAGWFDSTFIESDAKRTPGKTVYCLSCNKPRCDLVLGDDMRVVVKAN